MAVGGKTLTVYLAADVSKLRGGLNDADRSLTGFAKNLSGMVGPALIGAAAAAGAFATKLAFDSVQAAIEDEASLSKLNTTLKNLGFDQMSDSVGTFIDKLAMTTGVADDQLRPAFDRILRSTGDITIAQEALSLSTDIAAAKGKDLSAVANALGKAYDGNANALGRLGLGLDSATLKSNDMNAITGQLSQLFGGQASAAAETFQGKMARLNIAMDEAKETIGYKLLSGIENIVDAFGGVGGLQGAIDETARGIGFLIDDIVTLTTWFGRLNTTTDNSEKGFWDTSTALSKLASIFPVVGTYAAAYFSKQEADYQQNLRTAGSVEYLTDSYARLAQQLQMTGTAISTSDIFSASTGGTPTGGYTETYKANVNRLIVQMNKLKDTVKQTTTSTGGMSKAVKEMDPALRKQIDLVKDLTSKVDAAGKALETARNEMNSWIGSMASNITSGINLGAAFDAMFYQEGENAGKLNGQSLLEGFNKQIEQAGLFGTYLKRLNSEGGPELRDAVAALGPEAGNKLAKEIIDQGLIPTMQSKLVDVQSMAETTAAEMVPPMLVAGVASAAGYLIKMQNELDASSSMLEEMGRKMGKTLSEAMVEEIRAALAAAGVAQAGAANVMAGQPANALSVQAQVAQRIDNPFMNATAIMQAIQTAIQQSDQRLGRTGQVLNA